MLDWEIQQRLKEVSCLAFPRLFHRPSMHTVEGVAGSAKHMNPELLIDRLLLWESRFGGEIDFDGKIVFELGAGPLLGWAPVAHLLGACKCYALEPAHNPRTGPALSYYFDALAAAVQTRLKSRMERDWTSFADVIGDQMMVSLRAVAEDIPLHSGTVDICLSNSVLEHVQSVTLVAQELGRITKPGGVHYHLIDLGDHSSSVDPFTNIYAVSPERNRQLHARRGMLINLARLPEVINAFEPYFNIDSVFRRGAPLGVNHRSIQRADPYWRQRFSDEDLAIKTSVLKMTRK